MIETVNYFFATHGFEARCYNNRHEKDCKRPTLFSGSDFFGMGVCPPVRLDWNPLIKFKYLPLGSLDQIIL